MSDLSHPNGQARPVRGQRQILIDRLALPDVAEFIQLQRRAVGFTEPNVRIARSVPLFVREFHQAAKACESVQ